MRFSILLYGRTFCYESTLISYQIAEGNEDCTCRFVYLDFCVLSGLFVELSDVDFISFIHLLWNKSQGSVLVKLMPYGY